jgi:hypothetical protein
MLNQLFHEECRDTNPSKCAEYDEFSKLFREIKFTKFDIEEFQRKLFDILDKINAKITQTKKVKAMKSEIIKLINKLNNASIKQDIDKIIEEIKKLLETGKDEEGKSLMEKEELDSLLRDLFSKIDDEAKKQDVVTMKFDIPILKDPIIKDP